ncbi:hypothetical protein ACWD4P_07435 [Kitasatospora sp. NPDC002543]
MRTARNAPQAGLPATGHGLPTDSTPTVSLFTVHRVNSLPVEDLNLALRSTGASLRLETALEQQLDGITGPLSEALHALVPALDHEPGLRRAVLGLRRAVHNGRSVTPSPAVLQAVSERLAPATSRLLARWSERTGRLAGQRAETDARYGEETARATVLLREALADPRLAQGLAHASPHLLGHLTSKPLEPQSKAARSVLGYVSRAALKTSPFSRLTALALDGVQPSTDGHSYVAQHHVRSWLDVLARDERTAAAFQVEPNDSARYLGDRPHLLVSSYNAGGTTAWRSDTLVDAGLYAPLLRTLAAWPRMTVAECLIRIGGEDPFAGYLRLLDTGWLRLVLPWRPDDRRPLPELARSLDGLDHPVARRTATLLRHLDSEAAELSRLPGARRVRIVEQLAASTRPGADGDPRPTVRFAVYEDAVADVTADIPGDHVRADLAELGRLIRPQVFRSHIYDWLRDEFVLRHGSGRRCSDVFQFLWEVAADPEHDRKFTRALLLDRGMVGRPTDRAWLPVSASSAPPTTAVLYQLAAASADDIRQGRHRLVVNQYNPGMGGLVARFRALLAPGRPGEMGLTEHLQGWVADAFPQAVPCQLTLSGDVNGMHRAADGVLPGLRWPGEPSGPGGSPGSASGITVEHDPTTDTLRLATEDGETIAPVYLGVVPIHLIPGVARLLLSLADPWVNGSRLSCTRSPLDATSPPQQGGVELLPGVSHGRLVLGRRTWRFAPGVIPRPEKGETPVAFFRRMHRWRVGHGIPDEVFLSVESSVPTGDQAATKPAWLSFLSPHAVWAAATQLGSATHMVAIRLAVAAPDRSEYWVRDGRGLSRAAEHISLLRWERPEPAQAGRHEPDGTRVENR